MNDRYLRKNAEVYEAIKNIDKENERFHIFQQLLCTIFYICDIAEFEIEGRIVLVDKKTGQTLPVLF